MHLSSVMNLKKTSSVFPPLTQRHGISVCTTQILVKSYCTASLRHPAVVNRCWDSRWNSCQSSLPYTASPRLPCEGLSPAETTWTQSQDKSGEWGRTRRRTSVANTHTWLSTPPLPWNAPCVRPSASPPSAPSHYSLRLLNTQNG